MRGLLRSLHRWCGLAICLFLVVSGATGSLLAFEHEIDAWLNPQLFCTASTAPVMTASALIERIEAQDPRISVTQLPLDGKAGQAIEVQVAARGTDSPGGRASKAVLDFDRALVDPGTGTILGTRKWGQWKGDRAHFMPWLNRFHRTLTLPGRWGNWLLGSVALVWLFLSLSGVYLTLPARLRKARPSATTTPSPGFLERWKPAWKIKRGTGGFRLINDLHRATGLWLLAVSISVAFSAIYLSLGNELFKPLVSLFGKVTAHPLTTLPTAPASAPAPRVDPLPRLSPEDGIALAQEQLPDAAKDYAPWYVSHIPARGVYRVAFKENGFRSLALRVRYEQIFIDDRSGQLRAQFGYASGTGADRFLVWLYPVHSGKVFGLGGRLLIAASGGMIVLLSITGLLRWLKRTRTPSRPESKR
ncbi:PepSY-associated TM helix domain-containing protein [Diaphorobacter caeni]|uniref:PepSY-associated TM helix domain-containing protein n=1 Tax=Diaphorobacter caeni TaxID=2784387 RepID=UPI00188DE860|nr:PepSY-associated TM helix domain-containing protein [Diaphorobacter caeni]MBF5007342.1 PepSY domain-containing protein [Diaphorobacter caeni]